MRVELGRGLEGGLTLLRRVVDDTSGAVVPGAEVSLRCPRPGIRARGSSGITDATGSCRLTGHTADQWFVFVRALGFASPLERYADFAAGEQFVEVRLSPARTLDLQFNDPLGTPRSGVSVCVTTLQGERRDFQDMYGNWDGDVVESDASGRVVAAGLPAGRVRVVVGWANGARVDTESQDDASSLANPLGLLVLEHDLSPSQRTIVRRVLR